MVCANCAGEGLVGQGEFPREKAGAIVKCVDCNGTGIVEDTTDMPEVKIETEAQE